jgi:hypothetical protein
MIRRRLLSLAVLLVLVPVAAGCGSDDKKDNSSASTPAKSSTTSSTNAASTAAYKTQIQIILTSVGTAGSSLGTAAQASKNATDIAQALDTFQGAVTQAADRLGKLTPPNDAAKSGQDELEAVLREIAQGVQPSIKAAKAGDRATFTTTFKAYQAKLKSDYRPRLTAAGGKIDQALASQ